MWSTFFNIHFSNNTTPLLLSFFFFLIPLFQYTAAYPGDGAGEKGWPLGRGILPALLGIEKAKIVKVR